MKQDAFFQTIIHHIGGEGNVARKRFDGEHLYVTVKDSGMADLEELNRLDGVSGTELNRNILSVTIQEDFFGGCYNGKRFQTVGAEYHDVGWSKGKCYFRISLHDPSAHDGQGRQEGRPESHQ
ncbi:MAG: hypothetical protein ACLS3Z_03725 [Faecalibacterium sp.]